MDNIMSDLNDLFRLHPRLAKKLSNDELRGLKKYIDQQVYNQSHKIISRLTYLEAETDVSRDQYDKDIETLSTLMQEDKVIAREYQREFTCLSNVLHNRDTRSKLQLNKLSEELEQTRHALENVNIRCEELNSSLWIKNDIIAKQKKEMVDLQTSCLKLVKEREDSNEIGRLSNDILKLKYAASNKDKEIRNLRMELDKPVKGITCDVMTCASAKYLQECRRELIAKCEETAIELPN